MEKSHATNNRIDLIISSYHVHVHTCLFMYNPSNVTTISSAFISISTQNTHIRHIFVSSSLPLYRFRYTFGSILFAGSFVCPLLLYVYVCKPVCICILSTHSIRGINICASVCVCVCRNKNTTSPALLCCSDTQFQPIFRSFGETWIHTWNWMRIGFHTLWDKKYTIFAPHRIPGHTEIIFDKTRNEWSSSSRRQRAHNREAKCVRAYL